MPRKVDPSWRTLCIKEPERTGSLPPEPGELMLLIEFSTDFSDLLFDLSSDLSSDKAWGIQGQVTTIRGQLTSQVPHHQRQHTSLPHTSPQDPDWKSLAENILNKVVTCSSPSVKKEIHLNICKLPLLHWIFAPKYQITFYTPNLYNHFHEDLHLSTNYFPPQWKWMSKRSTVQEVLVDNGEVCMNGWR